MSDEVVTIATSYGDVAELAQGYMNRVDGHRLLVPLAASCSEGEGVRFAIALADGTPAFMGEGRCSQVTDQGDAAPGGLRFETLLDSLQFDERSQPVYDYIVAIRTQAVGTQEGAPAEAAAEPSADANEPELEASYEDPDDDEPTEFVNTEAAMADMQELNSDEAEVTMEGEAMDFSDEADAAESGHPSFVPPAIPTGILSRAAISMHWQPARPIKPAPAASTGQFRYEAGSLPAPGRPPFPELDPSQYVQPAPGPGAAEAVGDNGHSESHGDEPQLETAAEPELEASDWEGDEAASAEPAAEPDAGEWDAPAADDGSDGSLEAAGDEYGAQDESAAQDESGDEPETSEYQAAEAEEGFANEDSAADDEAGEPETSEYQAAEAASAEDAEATEDDESAEEAPAEDAEATEDVDASEDAESAEDASAEDAEEAPTEDDEETHA